MMKSCHHCGGIHPIGFQCPKRPKRQDKRNVTMEDRFRWSRTWKAKREQIKRRDDYMCQLCIRRLYHTIGRSANFKNTAVHHIIPLKESYERRMAGENLLTLCAYHHQMAEDGEIPRKVLLDIAQEQEQKTSPRG